MIDIFLNTSLEHISSIEIVDRVLSKKLSYLDSGRPFLSSDQDISISHKHGYFYVSVVGSPCIVGVDIEDLGEKIDDDLFLKNISNKEEFSLLKEGVKDFMLNKKELCVVLWSIKESFFKCIDYKLDMKNVRIKSFKNDRVSFCYFGEVKDFIENKKISEILCTFKIINSSLVVCKTKGLLSFSPMDSILIKNCHAAESFIKLPVKSERNMMWYFSPRNFNKRTSIQNQ